jgi:hypothetical protein
LGDLSSKKSSRIAKNALLKTGISYPMEVGVIEKIYAQARKMLNYESTSERRLKDFTVIEFISKNGEKVGALIYEVNELTEFLALDDNESEKRMESALSGWGQSDDVYQDWEEFSNKVASIGRAAFFGSPNLGSGYLSIERKKNEYVKFLFPGLPDISVDVAYLRSISKNNVIIRTGLLYWRIQEFIEANSNNKES